jgi:inosose dehydratase
MKSMEMLNRRRFLKHGLAASTVLASATVSRWNLCGAETTAGGNSFRGLKVGIASYSLRKFTLDQAIAMTRQAGVKHICLKDFHLPYKSTPAQRREARQKIEAADLVLMGGGVIYFNTKEDEIRSLFDYARDAGMPTIVCSPDPAALDTVERLAREYRIRIAIHNHGPGDQRYPSPLDVLKMVQARHELMGICMDVGHTVRIGEEPVEVIKRCGSRLYDFHIKDVTEATAKGGPVEVGKGVIDTRAVLKALLDLKYSYHLALEYEANADAPMPGINASFDFIRKALAAMG